MARLTKETREELIALVMELQAHPKGDRVIFGILLERGLTDGQAKLVMKQARERWASVSDTDPAKTRLIEVLMRQVAGAERDHKYTAAIRGLSEIAKVTGVYEATKVEVTGTDSDKARLQALLAKYEGEAD